MIGMTAYLSDQRDALQEKLDASVRREQRVTVALEQVLLFIDDALLCCDEDVGAMRDYLYAARDAGVMRAS